MNGKPTYNNSFLSRRNFLWKGLLTAFATTIGGFISFRYFLRKEPLIVKGKIKGASVSVGHLLRNINFEQSPVQSEHYDFVIVGAGISGLSAARWLHKNGITSFKILELEPGAGGNSSFDSNSISLFPLGAHYIPLPNNDLKELLAFLEEHGVITGYDNAGLPIYDDYALCHDPAERLYIHHHWQNGLIPEYGVPQPDIKQIKAFLALMGEYKTMSGKDGKPAFHIPVDTSTEDALIRELDTISMKEFMMKNGFTSPFLQWYVDYCCRDDYGSNLEDTSSWAGIHYYASRKGKAANADPEDVLTWPEGNGRLMNFLKKGLEPYLMKNSLVYSVKIENENVVVDYLEIPNNAVKRITASKCIMATPQFVNKRIVTSKQASESFNYSPWMVANITINQLSDRKGRPLSWDNVIYGSRSLGYVCANHQDVAIRKEKQVLTYYLPLSDLTPVEARNDAIKKTHQEWSEAIVNDLRKVHKDIAMNIENIDIWLWGHGMIRPVPGFIWSEARKNAAIPVQNKIYFAHSDLSGVSIFEEAFYKGINAAKQCLSKEE